MFILKKIFCFVCCLCLSINFFLSSVSAQDNSFETGVTEAIHEVIIRAPVPGNIDTMYVGEGDVVGNGASLLNLDNNLEKLDVKFRKLIWEDKTQLQAVNMRIDILGELYNSTKKLYDQSGSVSREEVKKLELEYRSALSSAERLKVEEQKEQIEYDIAKDRLNKKKIRAPFSGIAAEIFLQVGDHCQRHQPIMRLVNVEKVVLICNVEENLARKFNVGERVDLQINSGQKWINKQGVLVFRSPVVHSASGLVRLKVEFSNTDQSIIPGTQGRILLN